MPTGLYTGAMETVAPVFGVANVRQAAEYYRDVFGFDLNPENGVFAPVPGESQGVYGIVRRGGIELHFQIRRGEAPKPGGPLDRHAYVFVSEVDSLHEDLSKRGAKVIQQPLDTPYGIREFVVEDLNGFRIAFGQKLP